MFMTSNSSEMVILVDEQDNNIGLEEKMRAHELGLLHRAFSVFILRKHEQRLELLLQQRQQNKYHCGGLWTNTCCSHPRVGETAVQAGERRLMEEMGMTAVLQEIGSFMYRAEFTNGLVEHEFDHVLVGMYNGEDIQFNTMEVQAYKWVTIADLKLDLAKNAHLYTPWLANALAILETNWSSIQG